MWDNEIIPKETVETIVRHSDDCFRDLGTGLFAIELGRKLGELVGFCGLRYMEEAEDVELGDYFVVPQVFTDRWVRPEAVQRIHVGNGDGTQQQAFRVQYRHRQPPDCPSLP